MRRLPASAWLLALALVGGTAAAAQPPAAADPMYMQLRNRAINTAPGIVGVTRRAGETRVYGVVMDIDMSGRTATIITFTSGDASLYLSNGSGQIGGIGRPVVAAAARALVGAVSPAQLGAATRVTSYPRPNRGETNFYFLTTQGVRMVARSTAALETGTDAFSPLYAGGQAVISGFREVEEVSRRN